MSKILVVTERYWPNGGGGILATHFIIKILSSFAKLTVLTGSKEPIRHNNVGYVYEPSLNIKAKPLLWANIVKPRFSNWLDKFIEQNNTIYIPRLAYPIVPPVKKLEKKVVVHLHDYQPITNCSVVFSHYNVNNSFDLINDIRNNVRFELLENRSIHRALLSSLATPINRLSRIWLREADVIICVSRKQREIVGSVASELVDKLKVIHNPLPKIPFSEKKLGKPTFMYIGGDSFVKGFNVFLRGSLEVLKLNHDVRFLLIGTFKESSRLLIEKLNRLFGEAYNLLGYLKHEEVLRLHSRSQALLFPSISEEALPYAVLESMLCGTIPIASRVGGVPEIVEGTFAEKMLFEPGNVDEFVDRVEVALSLSKDQLIDIGTGLRESVYRRFNNELIKQQLLKVFSS